MAKRDKQGRDLNVPVAPQGLAISLRVGPSTVWAAKHVGPGEVILATLTGAILATLALFGYLCVTQIPSALVEILRAGK